MMRRLEDQAEDSEHGREKQQAAERAVEYVESSMVIGLGAGSTALLATRRIGGWPFQRRFLESLGARVVVRGQRDGTPFQTDQGNVILDCAFGPLRQPAALAAMLDARAGIVEHGLFIGLATEVIVGGVNGVQHLTPKQTGARSDGRTP